MFSIINIAITCILPFFVFKVWRSFSNDRKTVRSHGFIDGDLIETFLDLPRHESEAICIQMGLQKSEILKAVEEIARLH